LHALHALEKLYPDAPASAQVTYQIIQFLYDHQSTDPTKKTDLPALKNRLDALIERFPDTEGAANASRLAQQLTDPSLALQTEEVVLPEENSKALITYRNVSKVYIRLYTNALPINPQQNRLTDEQRAQLLQTKPIRSWQQALPSAE